MANQQLDDYLVQQILSRFILPFDKWPAYQLGIIDRNGKVLKKKSQLRTQTEKNAWGYLDILCCNLRKILMDYPTTRVKFSQLNTIQTAPLPNTIGGPVTIPLASLASSFFLLKDSVDPENIMQLRKKLNEFLDEEFYIHDNGKYVEIRVDDGNNPAVGAARIVKGNKPYADFVRVDKEYRGRGIANQMYDRIEKLLGQKLVPSHTQSSDSKRLWARRNGLKEDAAVNSAGGGAIAGIGVSAASGSPPNFAEPPMRRKTTASRLLSRIKQGRRGWDSFWRR